MFGADATVFASAFAALYVAHEVGDHWVQTHRQALAKGGPGWAGRLSCAAHVATLTTVKALTLGVVVVLLALPVNVYAVVAALGLDALSHYWADRKVTLIALAERVGKGDFARLGDGLAAPAGTGAYALDQSWHVGWLLLTALGCSLGAAS